MDRIYQNAMTNITFHGEIPPKYRYNMNPQTDPLIRNPSSITSIKYFKSLNISVSQLTYFQMKDNY